MPGRATAADAGEFGAAVEQQRVDQRAAFRAGGGVDDEAGWLVDDDEVLVLEHHVERDVLGLGQGADGGRERDGVGGGCDHLGAGVGDRLAVERDAALLDQDAQARPGHACSGLRQPFVQPIPGGFRRGHKAEGFGGVRRHAFVAMRCEVGIHWNSGPGNPTPSNPGRRINP